MTSSVSAIAVIPAKGTSRRIERKNLKPFAGRPIIEYSILTALESQLFEHVIVSTEDDEVARVAKAAGAETRWRPPELLEDHVGTQEVAAHVVREFLANDRRLDYVCVIYATAPLLEKRDLVGAFGLLQANRQWARYVASIGTEPFLHDAGQFYFGDAGAFVDAVPIWDRWTILYALPPAHISRAVDINVLDDWARAERVYAATHALGQAA